MIGREREKAKVWERVGGKHIPSDIIATPHILSYSIVHSYKP